MYFKIYGLYFKISALYFCVLSTAENQRLDKDAKNLYI